MIISDELRFVPLFAELDEDTLCHIAETAADVHVRAGEWIAQEGDAPWFYVLLSGTMEVSKIVAGNKQILRHYNPGDYFGEVPILLGSGFLASFRAETPVRLLKMDPNCFHALIVSSDAIAAAILQTMTERITGMQRVSVDTPIDMTLIVGHVSDNVCYELRQFLSCNLVNFHWLDPDLPRDADRIPECAAQGPYPVVVLPNGSALICPSRRDVAVGLGLQVKPSDTQYDVVIIGGGPAGLAAAVYGASEGLKTLMVDCLAPGGQAGTSSRIENYLGFPTGISGSELSTRGLEQAKRFGVEVVVTCPAEGIEPGRPLHSVHICDGVDVNARAVIIATGVSWRTLSVPGTEAFLGKGLYYGAARTEALGVRGKNVYLIGGGNSAGQAAMFFADYAECVTLLIRAASIEAGMSQYLIDQIGTKDNIRIWTDTHVTAVHGDERLNAITVENCQTNIEQRLETDSVFVFIGADAKTDWLPESIARDDRGYIITGIEAQSCPAWNEARQPFLLETSVPGIFAAGDVRHNSIKRVASAVGEGSMAIAFIHQFLAL
jgi:thioredoxin reductase (NADPH)